MTIPVGIIGAGRRGTAHGNAAIDSGLGRVVSVCDIDLARAQALAERLAAKQGSPVQAYRSPEELLDAGSIVAVYITTPPPAHAAQTIAALERGLHVVLEKPIALTMEDAYAIDRARQRAGTIVHVCQQQRYAATTDVARRILEGRKVGLARVHLYRQRPDIRGNWDRRWGGGHIVEWAIHPIDLCRYLIGEVTSVYAAYSENLPADSPDWDNWDSYAVTLRFANGAVGSVATTYALFPGIEFSYTLDIVAEGGLLRWSRGLQWITPQGIETFQNGPDPTTTVSRVVLEAIQTGDTSKIRISYDDAMRTLAVVLGANRSAVTGEVVHLD
jgi:predicted dehydrogenase